MDFERHTEALETERAEIMANVRLPEVVRHYAQIHLVEALENPTDKHPYLATLSSGYLYAEQGQAFGIFNGRPFDEIEAVAADTANDADDFGAVLANLTLGAVSSVQLIFNADVAPFDGLQEAFEATQPTTMDLLGYTPETWPEGNAMWASFQLGAMLFAVEIQLITALRFRARVEATSGRRRWPWRRS